MRLTAMPLHDATRDLILLNQQRLSDVEVKWVGIISETAVAVLRIVRREIEFIAAVCVSNTNVSGGWVTHIKDIVIMLIVVRPIQYKR
jgi:hypothetical protein